MKHCLTGILSGAEMIDGIFKLHPQRPRHSSRMAGAIANVKCLDLTLPSSFALTPMLLLVSTGCDAAERPEDCGARDIKMDNCGGSSKCLLDFVIRQFHLIFGTAE
jgi:hypothetical protein